MGEFYITRRTI